MMDEKDIKDYHKLVDKLEKATKVKGLKNLINTTICKANRSRTLEQENVFMR